MVKTPGRPEVYLIPLGLVIPEQLPTGTIENRSTSDQPLYLPAG